MEKNVSLQEIARIQAMKIIYMADFNGITVSAANVLSKSGILDNDEVTEKKEIQPYAIELIDYISDNISTIDKIIDETLVNYSLGRLNLVDKAIIRVSTAELLLGKLDKKIIINEALEITKIYSDLGDHKAVSFNNKLLDNISKKIGR
ncbi:MAG: transcription antitermination protein NusB [Acholeplasmatales bacterium]|jgi:N utilization substance protein B|nr:transcription antitermination protein NusB [Acholeplasmatales bacterium]